MAENTKSPEELAVEKKRAAMAIQSALSHFSLKLRFVDNETPIEDQLPILAKYNDTPSNEKIANSSKVLDSYRKEFLLRQYDKFFADYPEMLDLLKEKKSDNNEINFLSLSVMNSLFFNSSDEETLKNRHKKSVEEYFHKVLPQYQSFFISYIVDNEKWELTHNDKTAFSLYAEIYNQGKEMSEKYENIILTIHLAIKDVVNNLIDKIVRVKNAGLDEESYTNLVSDIVISKYVVLRMLINDLAGNGVDMLPIYINTTFKEYTLTDIYNSISIVESKLLLDKMQKEEIDKTKKMLELLRSKGIGGSNTSDNSGCSGLLLALVIPASLMLFCL